MNTSTIKFTNLIKLILNPLQITFQIILLSINNSLDVDQYKFIYDQCTMYKVGQADDYRSMIKDNYELTLFVLKYEGA